MGQLPRLPSRLLAHLRRWHRIDAELGVRFVCHYQGSKVRKLRRSLDTARRAAGLGEDVIPHALRHTAATWLMQRGCDMWEAAGYLGMRLRRSKRSTVITTPTTRRPSRTP